MDRQCTWCQRELAPDNSGKLCLICAAKLETLVADLPEVLDAEGVAELLYSDVETVRRKHRHKELPDCIPGWKKLLWFKEDIMAYLRFGRWFSAADVEELQATAAALKLGYPIDQLTGYGHCPENLVTEMKRLGHIKDRTRQPQ
jgi:hypothetical protein